MGSEHDSSERLQPHAKHDRETALSADLSPSLLGLPAEVRNRVYQFALTSTHALIARRVALPDRSVGFCQKYANTEWYKKSPFKSWDDSKIILCALDSNRKAHVRRSFKTQAVEHNLLKYVCRQLYTETAGIEVGFNAIQFTDRKTPGGSDSNVLDYTLMEDFLGFIRACKPAKLLWFKEIWLRCSHTGFKGAQGHHNPYYEYVHMYVLTLLKDAISALPFCKAHPHIQVKLMVPNWIYSTDAHHVRYNWTFLQLGAVISKMCRDADLGSTPWGRSISSKGGPAYLNDAERLLLEDRESEALMQFREVKNLRFFPQNYGEFPGEPVLEESKVPVGLPVMEWYENGI